MKDLSRLDALQAVTYTVKVVVSEKCHEIDTLLLRTTNRKYHMTLKVICLMQDLTNAIRRTAHGFN